MRVRSGLAGAALVVASLVITGCGGDPRPPRVEGPATLAVTSAAFQDGGAIPARFTCDGDGVSPELTWSGVPAAATALALVVDDPDAPGGTYTHWVVLDIPVAVHAAEQGSAPGVQARNSAGDAAYAGPCPPSGTHHYRFTVYALDGPTGLGEGVDLGTALAAIDDHSIGWGRLTGTYAR